MITIENVFDEKHPNWAKYDSEEGILYDDNNKIIPVDTAAILLRLDEMVAESKDYIYWRTEEYPPIEDQLDMQYWDLVNGTTVWLDTVQAIKDQFPKE